MTKILVVDDEADLEVLIKQKFRKKIREGEYEFVFAINGKEALNQLSAHPDTKIVLSDINMPEMDGLTLLSNLNKEYKLLKSIIISAYGDMENIRTAMNRGAFDFLTKPVDFSDLEVTMEKTIQHVQQLHETIRAIKENDILKMYVDENVINFMNTREFENSLLVNETIEATVAFIDICGFTAFSEKESPDAVVKLLNSYFDVIAKEIIAQNGLIDKFIGDATMVVFKGDYHLDRAIDACLAVKKEISELPEKSNGIPYSPQVSIGINSGQMISGNTGSAALRRLDFTVIGDEVNTAHRLQDVAKDGQILITEASYEKIKESFKCNKVGLVNLKNKSKPVVAYEVLE